MGYNEWREKLKKINDEAAAEIETNRERRHLRTGELMSLLKQWPEFSFEMLTPYQYRIYKGSYAIDYYPTSGKYYDINQKFWGIAEPAEIINLFPEAINWNLIND